MRADDREDDVGRVTSLDDHNTGQGHDPDHHGEAGKSGDERRQHAWTREDLLQGSRGLNLVGPPAGADEPRDPARVRPDCQDEQHANEHEARSREPGQHEGVSVELAVRYERAEYGGSENGPEDGSEEHEGDSARSSRGRIHIPRGGTGEQRRRAGGADAGESK